MDFIYWDVEKMKNQVYLLSLLVLLSGCPSDTDKKIPPNNNSDEINTAFGQTVEFLMNKDIFSDPYKYFNKNDVDIERPESCDDLRGLLTATGDKLKPVYILMDKTLSSDTDKCSRDESPFMITRNSEVFIDGSNTVNGDIDHFVIRQKENGKNSDKPLLIISNDKRVLIKGFLLRGGRNGIVADIKSRVYMGDVIITEPAKEGILITDTGLYTQNQSTSLFGMISDASANHHCTEVYRNETTNPLATVHDGCVLSFYKTVTINTTSSIGLDIRHTQARAIVNDSASLIINNPTTGVNVIGTLQFKRNGILWINNYSETGINLGGGRLLCDKSNPVNHFEMSGNPAPVSFTDTNSEINTCLRNIGDFNGDVNNDFLWRNTLNGKNWVYLATNSGGYSTSFLNRAASIWKIEGIGDFDGDGKDDIFWRNQTTGQNWMYLMNGASISLNKGVIQIAPLDWQVEGIGDFNGDGKDDIFLRKLSTEQNRIYSMNGTMVSESYDITKSADPTWQVTGAGDFNGDGKDDIFWRHSSGQHWIYLMNDTNTPNNFEVKYYDSSCITPVADTMFIGIKNHTDNVENGKDILLFLESEGATALKRFELVENKLCSQLPDTGFTLTAIYKTNAFR